MRNLLLILILFCSFQSFGQGNFFWSHGSIQLPPVVVSYGYLYNYDAVHDVRGLAPVGWHIPTTAEWLVLANYMGGQVVAGGKIREIGSTYWTSPNTCATNDYGFNARGTGQRNTDGSFSFIKNTATWFSTTGYDSFDATYNTCILSKVSGDESYVRYGRAVRYVKDNTTDVGYMIGNDGQRYNTVTIGTQVWTSEDSRETRYRNGNLIPLNQDASIWTIWEVGQRCYYVIP